MPDPSAIDVTGTLSYQTTSANKSLASRFAALRTKAVPSWSTPRALRDVERARARPTFDFQFAQEAQGSPSEQRRGSTGRSSVWDDPWQQHLVKRMEHDDSERAPRYFEERRQRILQQPDWLNLGQAAASSRSHARPPRSDVYLTERSVSPPDDAMLRGSSVYRQEPSSPLTVSIRLSSPSSDIRSVDAVSRAIGFVPARTATPPRTDAFSTAFSIVSPQKGQLDAASVRPAIVDYSSTARQDGTPFSPFSTTAEERQPDKMPGSERLDDFLSGMAVSLKVNSSPAAAVSAKNAADQANDFDLFDFPSSAPELAVSSTANVNEGSRGRSPAERTLETPEGSHPPSEQDALPTRFEADLPKLPDPRDDAPAVLFARTKATSLMQLIGGQQRGILGAQMTDSHPTPSPFLDCSQYTWPPSSPPRHLRHLYEPEIYHLPDKLQEADLEDIGGVILVHEGLGLGCDSIAREQASGLLSRELAMRHSGIEPLEWGSTSDGKDSEAWGEEDELDEAEVDEGYIAEQDTIKQASPPKITPSAPLPDGLIFDQFDDMGILEP
ncbi:oxidoreductase [Rhodotorula toruloides]|uniref:Oxidoreductase n=1 Tax=Rhodotorula toruloides TaxID=5286 RepID=A0A511KKA2_RHOTO|nr:oxidoreductase [Rhodotorula toruloides]